MSFAIHLLSGHWSRLLPLHNTTRTALEQYLRQRRRVAGDDPHLFVSSRGGKLSHATAVKTFHDVVTAAGIPREPGRPRPRLMDLRHTFAVRGLESCPGSRDQVRRQMLALTTYLGHAKVESTYWYLESTPELLGEIAVDAESFMQRGRP